MATYIEQWEVRSEYFQQTASGLALRQRVIASVWNAAEAIRNELPSVTNHANRLLWSKQAFQTPESKADEMIAALIAANAGATKAQILGANDASVQSAVNAAIDVFATGS